MNMTPRMEYGLVLFLILVFLMPCAVVVFVSEEVPFRIIPGEPVKDAAEAAGITITRVKDTSWNLPGAIGGKTYILSDRAGNLVTVSTQAFDSAESRDAAILLYNAHPLGRGKPVGNLLVVGQHLVYVTPANSEILQEIALQIKKTVVL